MLVAVRGFATDQRVSARPDFSASPTLKLSVEEASASDAVTWLESIGRETGIEDAAAAIRNAEAVAVRLDAEAIDLHRQIDDAIDHDVAAVGRLTRELRGIYFDRDRIRGALGAVRARRPQLFETS